MNIMEKRRIFQNQFLRGVSDLSNTVLRSLYNIWVQKYDLGMMHLSWQLWKYLCISIKIYASKTYINKLYFTGGGTERNVGLAM